MQETALKRKVVLITGSSIGIGREDAFAFAKEGCKVIVTYFKDGKEARAVQKKCLGLGAGDVFVVKLNVMDDESIKETVRAIVAKFGSIDILVNNAGVIVWKPLIEQTNIEIENQIRTNLEGLIKMTRECLPHVRKTIINIASGAGIDAYADLSVYCATKFGVRGFTQAIAIENPKLKIFAVNPTTTATRMTNFQGMAASKVAEVVVNAAKGRYNIPSGGDVNVWEVVKW